MPEQPQIGCLIGEAAFGEKRLQAACPSQQACGRLCPNPTRARKLVGGVASQRDEIRHLTGIDAVPLVHLSWSDPGHFAGTHRMEDGGQLRGELERIAIAARDQRQTALALFPPNGSGKKVISLVSSGLGVREATGGNEGGQESKLLDQLVIEMAAGLVGRKGTTPVGRCLQRVPADHNSSRPLLGVEAQKHIGEADDCAATLVAGAADGLRKSMVGAMGERVPVYDQERTSIVASVRCLITL